MTLRPEPDLQIRPMHAAEVALALDWAAAEGWNPGLQDSAPFFQADPEGFLIALQAGEPVSMIAATRYGPAYGFIGFYIARPDQRGKGLGLAVWKAATRHLAGRLIGLDGVPAQQDNYRKSGFVLAHRNVRHEGQAASGGAPALSPGQQILPASEIAGEALHAYDRAFFPAPREGFIDAWVSQPGTIALGLMSGQALTGYGVIRPCRNGWKIGPLFADSPQGAEALFTALSARARPGEPLFLDVPQHQPEALALARRHGMHAMFETARMYTGPAPSIAMDRTYGITSFELG